MPSSAPFVGEIAPRGSVTFSDSDAGVSLVRVVIMASAQTLDTPVPVDDERQSLDRGPSPPSLHGQRPRVQSAPGATTLGVRAASKNLTSRLSPCPGVFATHRFHGPFSPRYKICRSTGDPASLRLRGTRSMRALAVIVTRDHDMFFDISGGLQCHPRLPLPGAVCLPLIHGVGGRVAIADRPPYERRRD